MIEAINEFVTTHAGAVWVLPAVFGLCIIDGFFPPLPSESVVVGLAAVATTVGEPNLWALFVVAALGAMIGDNIAYAIGRHGGLTRLNHSSNRKVRNAMAWASSELDKRGAVIIMAARYIPVGRVAVNITAGATRYSRPRFIFLDFIAATSWAAYSIAIGTLAGRWLHDNPVLATVVAVTGGVLLGLLVDRLLQSFAGAPAHEKSKHTAPRKLSAETVREHRDRRASTPTGEGSGREGA